MREAESGSQSRGKYSRKYNRGKAIRESRDKAARRRREWRPGKTGQGGAAEKAGDAPRNGRKPERKNSTEKRFPGFGSPNRRFRREPLPVSPQPTTQSIARPATFCQQFGPRPAIQSTTRPATQATTAKGPACAQPANSNLRLDLQLTANRPEAQTKPATRATTAKSPASDSPQTGQKRKPGPQHGPRLGQRPGLRTTRQFEPAARPAAHRKPARSANQARNTGQRHRPATQAATAKSPGGDTTRSSGSAAGPELGADHSSSAGST